METNNLALSNKAAETAHGGWIAPMLMSQLITSAIILLVALVIFFALKRVFQILMKRANLPSLMFRPLRLTLRYGVLIVAFGLVLDVWGIKTQTLMTVVGTVLGLVAIGFVAVWSVLSNFLCTFVLILFKPFSIGDELDIPSDSVKGKVVDLTLIFTTLRTPEGEYVQVPNNMFFQKVFRRRAGKLAISLQEQLGQQKPVE